MPGVTLICDNNPIKRYYEWKKQYEDLNILNKENLNIKILAQMESSILYSIAFENYPIDIAENNDFLIIIEGNINNLNKQVYCIHLLKDIDLIFKEDCSYLKTLSRSDGDFIIYFIRKSDGKIIVVNDALGRLPLYILKKKNQIILTREIGILKKVLINPKLDKISLGEIVLFGYTLGNRTALKEVKKVYPASVIHINPTILSYSSNTLFQYNFDEKRLQDNLITDNAKILAKKIVEIIQSSQDNNILSLSGGLDSRSIAFALYLVGKKFKAYTYKKKLGFNASDVSFAKQIADSIAIQWEIIKVGEKNPIELFKKLFATKSVHTSYALTDIVEFLEKLHEKCGGKGYYITGDGGDKVLHDLRPNYNVKNIRKLTEYILLKNGLFPYKSIEKLFNLPKKTFKKEIEQILNTYPEKKYAQKYIHFIIFERGRNWLFEGEDRNRYFFWQFSPFYNQSFMNVAMSCPDEQKSNYKLYEQFIKELSFNASNIGYPDLMGTKLGSKAQKRISFFMNILFSSKTMLGTYRRFKNIYNDLISRNRLNEIRRMFEYVEKSQYINIKRLKKIVNSRQYMNYNNLCNLFTINSLINEYNNDRKD